MWFGTEEPCKGLWLNAESNLQLPLRKNWKFLFYRQEFFSVFYAYQLSVENSTSAWECLARLLSTTDLSSKFYILSYTVNLQASHIKDALYKGKKWTPGFPINRPVNIIFCNKLQFDFLIR